MPVLPLEPNWRKPSCRVGRDGLVIGLVNNMPDAALRSTERQFSELLASAARGRAVGLRTFWLPGINRSPSGLEYVREHYEDVESLWDARLDGLIVTGTEPRAQHLADEPYWPALNQLVDWASRETRASVWSCLAAHAAVQCLDGIERNALRGKLSGVYEAEEVGEHPLVGMGPPARWRIPHSRHNEIAVTALAAADYRILVRSAAGADFFVKRRNSRFLFLQGHPEYDAGALLREYRRDVGRFLTGESSNYPPMPHCYFGGHAMVALNAFRDLALRQRKPDLISRFPAEAASQDLTASWRDTALRLYANWLSFLADRNSPHYGSNALHGARIRQKAAPVYP